MTNMTNQLSHLNIWFNRAFSTTYWIIKMIKENPDGVPTTIHATHPDSESPVLLAADVIGTEPSLTGDEYVDWCLDYCVTNNIDVFVPRLGITDITRERARFEEKGITILASDHSSIELLEDKNKTYLKALETGTPVPAWEIGSTASEIEAAHTALREKLDADEKVVIKPTVGVGAEGFRVINNEPYDIDRVLGSGSRNITLDDLLFAYDRAEKDGKATPEIMLLPWLEDPEISVDTLSDPEGNIVKMLPRSKDTSRRTSFTDRFPQATEIVEKWYENFDLRYLTNTQLRWWRDELVLLETNTRASGGLYSSKLTGLNLMWEAIVMARTGEVNRTQPKLNISYISLSGFTEVDYPY
jgi:biotin carboxylase